MDAVAYCQKLGTYQWISLIVAVIIVIIIIILLSLNFANNLNSSARQSDGSINLSSSQGKSTRTYNIISIVLLIVLLLIGPRGPEEQPQHRVDGDVEQPRDHGAHQHTGDHADR